MVEDFLESLQQVGMFLIIGQTILHFRAGKQYEKYMKLMISMMVMSQLMIPIFSIFNQEIGGVMTDYLAEYQAELKEFEQMQEISTETILEMNQRNYDEFLQQVQEELEVEGVTIQITEELESEGVMIQTTEELESEGVMEEITEELESEGVTEQITEEIEQDEISVDKIKIVVGETE